MSSLLERVHEARATGPQPARRRGAGPLLIVWGAWLLLMAGADVPAPLSAVYAQRFGFSSAILAVVFATYASVLVPATAVGAAIWHGRTAR